MLAILLAAALAAAPAADTIFTADGARVQGTVVEEGAKGVTVQLADGTTRTFPPGQVVRIEYSDGSVSTPKPAPPPPAAAPVPAQPAPQKAAGALDTIFFAGGGRARGTVVEETAAGGVTVRMSDGTTRRYPPGQVVKVEYADGTVSTPTPRAAPAIPPPPPAWPPVPPSYPPPPPAKPLSAGMPPLLPWYLSFGIGGVGFTGDAEPNVPMGDVTHGQVAFLLETGLRLTPEVALAAYANFGIGDAASQFNYACGPYGGCGSASAGTTSVGGMIRGTFHPNARVTPSLAVGSGYSWLNVSANDNYSYGSYLLAQYQGWQMLRVVPSIEFRTSRVFGIGLYFDFTMTAFSHVDDRVGINGATPGSYDISAKTISYGLGGGVRMTLFP